MSEGVDERLSVLQAFIGQWADETFCTIENRFGKSIEYRGRSIVGHLRKEIDELAADPANMEEIADCMILLFHLAHQNLYHAKTFDTLFKAITDKMEVNKKRKWGKPDKNGVIEHVDDEPVMEEPRDQM